MFGTLFPFCSKPWNPFLLCLEPCVFARFYGLLGKNVLNLLLWKAQNPVSLLVSMDCSESWFFAFFYGLLRTQLVYPLLWTLFPLCSEPWNPFPLCWESCVFACFYWLIGTQHLCLLLWKAWNPDSLPVCWNSHVLAAWPKSWAAFILGTLFPLCLEPWNPFLLCLEPCIFAKFYRLFGTQLLFLLLWKVRNTDTLPVTMYC